MAVMDWWAIGYVAAGIVGIIAFVGFICTSYDAGHREGHSQGFSEGWNRSRESFEKSNEHKIVCIYRQAAERGFGAYEVNTKTGNVEWRWKEPVT